MREKKSYKQGFQFFCLLFSLFTLACGDPYHDPVAKDNSGGPTTTEPTLDKLLKKPEEIVYSHVKEFVLDSSCIKCHNSNVSIAGVDVSSFEKLTGNGARSVMVPFNPDASSLYSTLLLPENTPRHMPPIQESQLSEDQINLVYQWIVNGSKLEIGQTVPRPKTLKEELQKFFDDPKLIDYPLVNKYVFATSCNDCHSQNGVKANFENAIDYYQNMTTYEDVLSNFGIVPDQLQDKIVTEDGKKKVKRGSRIYRSIAIHQSMPRDSDGYEPMEALRVKLLRLWIINCAIEDYSTITNDDLKKRPNSQGKIRNCPKD